MLTSRKAAQAAVTAVALVGSLAVSAPPAAAATTAPSCIGRMVTETTNGFDVLLSNNCSGTRSVRVVVSLASDSRCYTLARGASDLYIYRGVLGNYDRTVNC
ncbi:beta-Ig-H3/fasciclin [Streptomyces uncialis]|uniref:beta-Ig-H3/fasciclin n=1 Tax=Streptomyces uncialis TaxID=1048205 RepID=UPI003814B692